MTRSLWPGLIAVALLAADAVPARADAAPWPFRVKRPDPAPAPQPAPEPAPQPGAVDPVSGLPYPPLLKPEPPRRTGPFRSCGSGMGLGLAGVGLAWAALWLGNRFAGRVSRREADRTR
jgi:hypothetical protein